jgi:hypothetical protein
MSACCRVTVAVNDANSDELEAATPGSRISDNGVVVAAFASEFKFKYDPVLLTPGAGRAKVDAWGNGDIIAISGAKLKVNGTGDGWSVTAFELLLLDLDVTFK